jgi:putative DNA primase/helicase
MSEDFNPEELKWTEEERRRIVEELAFKGFNSSAFFSDKGIFQPAQLSLMIQKHYQIRTLKGTKQTEIYIYNEQKGIYEANGDEKLREVIKRSLGESYREHYANDVINDITACSYIDREDFDNVVPNLLPVQNGVLDLSKSLPELLPHSPKYYFTGVLPIKYDPNAKCPEFLKFLEDIQPDFDLSSPREQIQEMFGYCLWRDYHHQVLFLLIGEGNNGRSTLLGVLRTLLGEKNVSAETIQSICYDKFSPSQLYRKYANISADIPYTKLKNTSKIKELTGGDSISAQRKFGQQFKFVNFAKLIFSANKVPRTNDKTRAFYRRPVLILFNQIFGTVSKPVDKNISNKLITPEDLSGILNWAIIGLKRLEEQQEFTARMTWEDTSKYYDRLSSPLWAFIQDCVNVTGKAEDYVTKDEFYQKFVEYCKEQKIPTPTTKEGLGRMMRGMREGGIKSGRRDVGDKMGVYVWLGCTFGKSSDSDEATREQTEALWEEAKRENAGGLY